MLNRYVKCTCGKSDGNDDIVISRLLSNEFHDFSGQEVVIEETRVCDICRKPYKVQMHYKFQYELLNEWC